MVPSRVWAEADDATPATATAARKAQSRLIRILVSLLRPARVDDVPGHPFAIRRRSNGMLRSQGSLSIEVARAAGSGPGLVRPPARVGRTVERSGANPRRFSIHARRRVRSDISL